MTTWDDLPLVLTAEQAAEVLQVHYNTIKKLCREGELPAKKVGRAWRIKREDLIAYLSGEMGEESDD